VINDDSGNQLALQNDAPSSIDCIASGARIPCDIEGDDVQMNAGTRAYTKSKAAQWLSTCELFIEAIKPSKISF
jgi:hypothetical protein